MKSWLFKALYFSIPVAALLVSVLTLNSGSYLKRPMGSADDVLAGLDRVTHLSVAGQWDEAAAAMKDAQEAWSRVKGRIHFTSSSDDIEIFDLELAGLQGAVESRDEAQVRNAHRRLLALWTDLGT